MKRAAAGGSGAARGAGHRLEVGAGIDAAGIAHGQRLEAAQEDARAPVEVVEFGQAEVGQARFKVDGYFETAAGVRIADTVPPAALTGKTLVLSVMRRWLPRCGECGRACRLIHQRFRPRRWMDLNWGEHPVVIVYAPVRVRCEHLEHAATQMHRTSRSEPLLRWVYVVRRTFERSTGSPAERQLMPTTRDRRPELERIRRLHAEYYERVREIIADRVVLMNLQLIPLGDGA